MRQIQCTYEHNPDFAVITGAFDWCYAMINGIPRQTRHGQTEWRCGDDEEYRPSSLSTLSLDVLFASKLQFVTDPATENWLKFQSLVSQWRSERGAMSSITEMVMLPTYQKIIGMGEDAIPLILAQLKSEGNEPDQWFWALAAITSDNPVKPEDQGDFPKMAQAWFKWAEEHDYAW